MASVSNIGGHRFFSKSEEVTAWWKARLPHDFIEVRRLSRIYYRGRFFRLSAQAVQRVTRAWALDECRLPGQLCPRAVVACQDRDIVSDWVSNRFGRRLFEIFFKTYTEKVWGMPCEEISADWAAQRIKGLSLASAVFHALGFGRRKGSAAVKTLIDTFQYPLLGPG